MRQLLPHPLDPVDPGAVYGDPPRAEGRPGVRLNMVASVDGAISVAGRSGGLGGTGDRRLFLLLRAVADVILVGAGTVRAEGYGPALLSSALEDRRREEGRRAVPSIAVVSRSCALDWESPFFTAAVARPLVVTVAEAPAERRDRAAEVAEVILAGDADVDLALAFAALGRSGAGSVLAEGGPTLNGQLAAAGLVDELCLSVSPRLVGGAAPRILAGADLAGPPELALASVCEEDGFLFLRYGRR
ncbi:MAG: pyrimidine reductase family protein [Actinomycetota bacterium]|nr:pyrimidine reductase family protein [Actinomycetota bacterium]